MATIGDRNKAAFEKLQKSLREQMDSPEGRHLVMMAALGQSILHIDPPHPGDPPPPVQGSKIDSLHLDDLPGNLDESQMVGELLEWLHKEGYIQPPNHLEVRRFHSLIDLQRQFFDERQK